MAAATVATGMTEMTELHDVRRHSSGLCDYYQRTLIPVSFLSQCLEQSRIAEWSSSRAKPAYDTQEGKRAYGRVRASGWLGARAWRSAEWLGDLALQWTGSSIGKDRALHETAP